MTQPPTGTVTFLFTDIEGSTRRWEEQPAAMQHALARHDALLRQTIEGHGGHVFKTMGDAFYAAFARAPDALAAAVSAQRALAAEGVGSREWRVGDESASPTPHSLLPCVCAWHCTPVRLTSAAGITSARR